MSGATERIGLDWPGWSASFGALPGCVFGYAAMRARNALRAAATDEEKRLNARLRGYPHNHVYRLRGKGTLPAFTLYRRLSAVTAVYPTTIESFLDVGCCRGYFVLDAARRSSCRIAVGIDVHEPFVSISDRVSRYLGVSNAAFHLCDLRTIADDPRALGGPFQVVTMLNTYHYAFWGSDGVPDAFRNHRDILRRLSDICTGTLILSARLEVEHLPSSMRRRAESSEEAADYTTGVFLEAASEFFEIRTAAPGPGDPLIVMTKAQS